MSLITELYSKIVPKDATKWTLSTGDFGINCILGATLIYMWPSPLMIMCAMCLWFATMGISYRIPIFAQDCARVGGGWSYTVLTLAVFCSILLSTSGLNMVAKIAIDQAKESGKWGSDFAAFDVGFLVIAGEIVITWMMMFFSVAMSVCNGMGSYMREKALIEEERKDKKEKSEGKSQTPSLRKVS